MPKKRKANKKHKAKKASGVEGPYGALIREFQRLDQGLWKAGSQKPNVPCVPVRGPFAVSDVPGRGKGAVATVPIVAGTTLLVCKPIAVVTDTEVENECEALLTAASSSACAVMRDVDDDAADESNSGEEEHADMDEGVEDEGAAPEGNNDTAVLIMAVASAIAARPQLWHGPLADLYPRADECSADGGAVGTARPVPAWNASDTPMAERLEAYLDSVLGAASAAPADSPLGFTFGTLDRARLKLLVRHNALSLDTSAEQLCFHARYKQLSGLALYHEASFFNHSQRPNVSRYSIGDILVLRANRDVRAGEELCISYIASEVLCEAPAVRTLMLGGRGFGCGEQDADGHESSAEVALDSAHGVHGPVLTPEVQDDICRAFPRQRLQEVAQLEADAEFRAEMLRCDHKTLSEIRAVAHMQMCEPELALEAWQQCLNFDTSMLPPYDEAVVAHAVQAALCALAHTPAQLDTAREMATLAATTHAIAFGGGRAFLRTRYAAEVAQSPILTMAGNGGGSAVQDAFWALVGDAGCDGALPLSPGEIASAAADAATCDQPLQKLTTHAYA